MKKLLAFILTAVMLTAVLAVSPVTAAQINTEDIIILYTNDVHCGVDTAIGYDGLMLYKREIQAQYQNVLTVDAGDAIQGMPVGTLSKGADIITLMNAVGYDAVAVGNHEFDYKIPELMKRNDELSCGFISCNFFDKRSGERIFDPYRIIESGGKKIAFVGVTTPESLGSSTPAYFQDESGNYIYTFCEDDVDHLYEVIQQSIDSAKGEGADYVILLAHLGEEFVGAGWTSMDVVAHTDGVDAVIDGHSHQITPCLVVQNKNGEDVPITQAGTKLPCIGRMTISSSGEIKTELIDTVPQPTDDMGLPADSWKEVRKGIYGDTAVNDLMLSIQDKNAEMLNTKVGETAFALCDTDPATSARMVRNSESNLGNFLTDAFREEMETDAVILNGGGLRATIPAGDITYNSILSVFPFQNIACAAKVSGQQILDYLEYAVMQYPIEAGSFAHVSGISYTIDAGIKSSVKIDAREDFIGVDGEYRVKDVKINGKPLELDKTYTLGSISYLLINGGDGHIFSGKCDVYIMDKAIDMDLIADHITANLSGVIPDEYADPYGDGRITVIDSAALLGDTDHDGTVTVVDASAIQRYLADLPLPDQTALLPSGFRQFLYSAVSDTDADGSLTVIDATFTQRWLASLPSNDAIGKPVL